jgi:tetratricopeptide (TPR) repeat protein
MSKLSLCTIVKNEEASLPRCLHSVKDVVDEMVVLDTGSTDRTPEIAAELGAKVYHYSWCDDFSAARNEALKYVEGEWVLVLDADEILLTSIAPLIREAIADEKNLVVNLIRREVGAAQSPYSLVSRLFRKHPDLKFSRPYHAIVDDSAIELLKKETHWQIANLPSVAILHYGYQKEAIASLDKYDRARKAMEEFFANNPQDPYVCSKLGALYLQMGEVKKGIELLKQGIKSNQAEPNVLFELYYSLGNAYSRQKEYEKASQKYQKAIAQPILSPLKLGAYNNLGNLLMEVGELNIAKEAYEKAIQIDPSFTIGYYNLGMIYKALNRIDEAIAAYQQAINIDPHYASAYQNLGVIFYKIGNLSESIKAFKMAIALHDTQNPAEAEKLRQGVREIGLVLDFQVP